MDQAEKQKIFVYFTAWEDHSLQSTCIYISFISEVNPISKDSFALTEFSVSEYNSVSHYSITDINNTT